MKIKKPTTKKPLLITSGLIIVILLGLFWYIVVQNGSIFGWSLRPDDSSSNTINYKPATNDQQKAGEDIKKQSVDNNDTSLKSQQNSNGSPDTSSTIPVTITSAIQNGSTVNIRSLIELVTNTGSCTLKLTKGSAVVTKTSGIQALATSSTCKGFDIPTSELSAGTWSAALSVTINSKTGHATKTVSVQ